MTPPKKKWSWLIWWWLFLWVMSLETLLIMGIFKGIDIVSFIVGIIGTILSGVIVFVVIQWLKSAFGRYPQQLFKTRTSPNRYVYKESVGKPLVYRFHKSGDGHGFHFFIKSKRLVDDIERIGIRPQAKISWLRSWLKGYNNKTRNIDSDERDNPPIRIVDVKDATHSGQIPQRVIDDGACGMWLHYAPAIKMKPDSEMVFWIEIQANKPWKGYIDFRLNTTEGRRVAHHPYELIRIRP